MTLVGPGSSVAEPVDEGKSRHPWKVVLEDEPVVVVIEERGEGALFGPEGVGSLRSR